MGIFEANEAEDNDTDGIFKPVSELLGMKFIIPSYQRGYRWTKRQVADLLDDIRDFKPRDHENEWYCLQPLVVKEINKKKKEWEVIDGQQRLTTIFLINHYFNQKLIKEERTEGPIFEYQTKEDNHIYQFLEDMKKEGEDVKINDDNIDYHYISSAYKAINDWVKVNKEKYDENDFKSAFLKKTKVIWYETITKDGRDIFSRINSGKIPLTNAELIKALFLNSSNFNIKSKKENIINESLKKLKEEQIRLKQLKIAAEWDIMETELNNDEFWLFINKEENNKETRIDYLFELIVGKPDSAEAEDDYFTFREFNKEFTDKTGEIIADKEKIITEKWKDIKRCFQTLKNWFEDRELYHKIGFLITVGEDIKNFLEKSQKENKSLFNEFINGKIKSKFKNIQIDKTEYLENGNNENIRIILLMHNIQTMLNKEKENSRFPFNRFKREKWDIEHIHAVATEMPEMEQHRKDWLNEAKEFINEAELTEKMNNMEKMNNYSTENFKPLFNDILDYFSEEKEGERKHEDINVLSNLVLLDMGTNRGYKNAVFPVKRKTIIQKDSAGVFVPLCTKNVFAKNYTLEIDQITLWGKKDREHYFNDIKKVLSKYLPEEDGQ